MVGTKQARGSVLVLKFFAKYCEPCVRTLPATEAIHPDSPDAGAERGLTFACNWGGAAA